MKLKQTEAGGRFLSCVGRFYGRSEDFELLRVKIEELNSVFRTAQNVSLLVCRITNIRHTIRDEALRRGRGDARNPRLVLRTCQAEDPSGFPWSTDAAGDPDPPQIRNRIIGRLPAAHPLPLFGLK